VTTHHTPTIINRNNNQQTLLWLGNKTIGIVHVIGYYVPKVRASNLRTISLSIYLRDKNPHSCCPTENVLEPADRSINIFVVLNAKSFSIIKKKS
jgi:hypothetical protein